MTDERPKTRVQELYDKERKYIESKYQSLLKGKNIIVLEPMDKERRRKIHKLSRNYPDMTAFNIGENGHKQVVLKYSPYIKEFLDFKTLIKNGNQAYYEKNYNECINCYTKLLYFKNPKSFIYAKLGLSYLKKGNKKTAIDYLLVANHLSKEEQSSYDYTDLIKELRGISDDENQKPYFKMQTEDFDNEEYYYDIDQLQEIALYSIGANIDVETACQRLGMTEEEIDIIRLMYAKEYYTRGYYAKGDKFLKVVEKSKNKTEVIKNLLDEIRKNKKFYINRSNPNSKCLTLSLKPKK